MSTTLKCPNPSCTYTFDASQVPTGVVLSCPRCQTQFTLGAPGAPTAPPLPARPTESELETAGRRAVEERDPDDLLPPRGTGRYQTVIVVGIVAVLLAGSAAAIAFKLMRRGERPPAPSDPVQKDPERNIAIDPLPAGWNMDDNTRLKVSSPYSYGFRRENPEAYVVFGSTKYGDGRRAPRPNEMRRDLLDQLQRKVFTTFDEEAPPDSAWLGQPVGPGLGLKFRARTADQLVWQGEAYSVTAKGLAYFWAGWCGEADFEALKPEFAAFRAKFRLLDLRNDWRETVAREQEYKNPAVPYTFTDAEDIWEEKKGELFDAVKKADPDLDRGLQINHTPRGDRNALADEAELRVYLLPPAGEPLAQARGYVQDIWTNHVKNANPDLPLPTFTELTGEPAGNQPPTAKGPTPVVRFESRVVDPATKKVISDTESRLVVASAVRVGDKTVVLHCWCELKKREVFEARFIQIASSLR